MKKLLLTTFLFFSLFSFGQVYKTTYYDSIGNQSIKDVNFKKVVFEKKDEFYKISTFIKNKLNSVKIVEDTINYSRNKEEIEYFENGKISKTSKYLNGKLVGDIVEYYENGLKKSIYYLENNIGSDPFYTIKEFWDINGLQKVKEGNGEFELRLEFHKKETVLRGNVVNGFFEGKWSSNQNEYPYYEEYYSKGKLLNGVKKDSPNHSNYYTRIYKIAMPKGGMNEFRKEIASQIKTKRQKSALEGTIIAKFIIDNEGKIKDPAIVKSLKPYFDDQLLEILNKSEKWEPGEFRGEKVKQYYTLPVVIRVIESE